RCLMLVKWLYLLSSSPLSSLFVCARSLELAHSQLLARSTLLSPVSELDSLFTGLSFEVEHWVLTTIDLDSSRSEPPSEECHLVSSDFSRFLSISPWFISLRRHCIHPNFPRLLTLELISSEISEELIEIVIFHLGDRSLRTSKRAFPDGLFE
ncbi:hypothetical protein PMAYCL1PPCAC_13384, partial [Pristionchus mayeri]